jgi:hypothetical protein
MSPKLHKRYSKAVLDEFRLPKAAKEQVVLGSIVNNYCELTNDGHIFSIKDTSTQFFNKDMLKGDSAFFQSHFGYLTSLHFMPKEKGGAIRPFRVVDRLSMTEIEVSFKMGQLKNEAVSICNGLNRIKEKEEYTRNSEYDYDNTI